MEHVKRHYITNLIKNSNLTDIEITNFLSAPNDYEYEVLTGSKSRFIGISNIRSEKLLERYNMKYVGMESLILSLEKHDEDKIKSIDFFKNIDFEYKGIEVNKLSDIYESNDNLSLASNHTKFELEMYYKAITRKFTLFTDKYYLKIFGSLYYDEKRKVKTEQA